MDKYYKYLAFGHPCSNRRKWTKDVFENNRLHLAHFTDLNDPMEAVFNASQLTCENIRQIRALKPNIVIGCFSKCYSDVLMWSHYADGHKGCCVEFEIPSMEDDRIIPVSYQPTINGPEGNELLDQCYDILSSKLKPWEYEQEHRYLRCISNDVLESQYVEINITKVYLGTKLPPKSYDYYEKLILKIKPDLDIQQIQPKQLTWWDGEEHPKCLQ